MQSNKQLLGLINDILDMSKIENGKMTIKKEEVSLSELINDIVTVVQPQIKEKCQNFDVFVSDIISENVYSDGVRLNQVIMNIISNAVKFTPNERTISMFIHQEPSALGEKYVCVHFEIKDNGIGMSEEFRHKIFDSFAREDNKRVDKTEGTGLGMAITKYIVDAMNGSIEVESEQGKGTEFKVTIDMEKIPDGGEEMILPSWKVLVVDDDELLCKSTISTLKELGVAADYAFSGESALKIVAENHDYDFILMDCRMKDMNGIETTRQIHKNIEKSIPVVIISAYDWSMVENEAISAGVIGFIQKPLFKSTLYNSLMEFSGKSISENAANMKKHKSYAGIRILVAEDNDINWEIINELLSQQGVIMEHAENGKMCVNMFNKSEIGYYSAIFMDIRMPLMDGYEATQEIRSSDRSDNNIPIIAMTANAFSDDIKSCIDCGMNAHVAKPIELQEVLRQLEKQLNL